MRFVQVQRNNTVSLIRVRCIRCAQWVQSDKAFADADGEPFKHYYCEPCKQAVEAK